MAKPAHRPAAPAPSQPEAKVRPELADDSRGTVPSPARALQDQLKQQLWAEAEPDDDARWPLYITLPAIFAVSGLLWCAILGGAWALLHR